jgi:hypothetical protein
MRARAYMHMGLTEGALSPVETEKAKLRYSENIERRWGGSATSSSSSSSAGAGIHDEPWPLLRLIAIGLDPVTFACNF